MESDYFMREPEVRRVSGLSRTTRWRKDGGMAPMGNGALARLLWRLLDAVDYRVNSATAVDRGCCMRPRAVDTD